MSCSNFHKFWRQTIDQLVQGCYINYDLYEHQSSVLFQTSFCHTNLVLLDTYDVKIMTREFYPYRYEKPT